MGEQRVRERNLKGKRGLWEREKVREVTAKLTLKNYKKGLMYSCKMGRTIEKRSIKQFIV